MNPHMTILWGGLSYMYTPKCSTPVPVLTYQLSGYFGAVAYSHTIFELFFSDLYSDELEEDTIGNNG